MRSFPSSFQLGTPHGSGRCSRAHLLPTIHLGRLAVDQSAKGQGLGRFLLFHFLKKALEVSQEVGVYAVDVWAKDEDARPFYVKYGFIELQDDRLHLYLPIVTVEQI